MAASVPRLGFLDWARGVAALIMLQGHVFDAFAVGDQRQDPVFVLSQFVGGMPPAIFLFLTGITLAFLMDSQERRELSAWEKLKGVAYRSRYLLVIAILFRLQMWAFAWPYSHWTDLLKVDVLNAMGVAVLLSAPLSLLSRMDRLRWSIGAGLAIAIASPLIAHLDWTGIPILIKQYLAPSATGFSLFPWAAFLGFGLAVGTMIRIVPPRELGRAAQWWALAGIVLIFGSQKLADLPYSLYPRSDFWIDSPWLVFIKLGCALILLSVAYLWNTHLSSGWSAVRQLGTTSLLVYWVHTELVYGRWLWGLRGQLSMAQLAVLAAAVILAMIGLSVLRTNWSAIRERISARGFLTPAPTEGD
jgi:uncharacterized membrane protein